MEAKKRKEREKKKYSKEKNTVKVYV